MAGSPVYVHIHVHFHAPWTWTWAQAWVWTRKWILGQGSIFWSVNDIYSPPPFSENDIFPDLTTHRFLFLSCPICLNSCLFCTYFTLYFSFSPSLFLLSFFPFTFPCLSFSLEFFLKGQLTKLLTVSISNGWECVLCKARGCLQPLGALQ
jgi:hypothetical protein